MTEQVSDGVDEPLELGVARLEAPQVVGVLFDRGPHRLGGSVGSKSNRPLMPVTTGAQTRTRRRGAAAVRTTIASPSGDR